ncbi:Response regulator receiver modulated metal dependent phosphohydrolase [Syntrophobacter sp. SbD1]|nr:Response regulator receiver modulated metal dependent phosphohydrolase [Syntrophobacter sp. SbD1]
MFFDNHSSEEKEEEEYFLKSSPKILVVDDSSTVRTVLRRQLQQMGARVTEAFDGLNGFETAIREDFDLVITDIEMPRMNGFTLCEKLKNHDAKKSIPIVLLSSCDHEENIERGFKLGVAAFISKSNAKTELRERVRELLGRNVLLRRRTILVVDDSGTTRHLVEKSLLAAGFYVVSAENGAKALKLLDNHRPDLILSDLNMPELDGVGLCKMVHANPELCRIPFIIMSANGDRATMRRLLQYGASAYLVKPFNLDQLVVTAEQFLSDHFHRISREKERLEAERQIIIGSITSLVLALEARDQYTRGHSESVASILVEMAREMAFDEELVEKARIAGKLHDLGKIGIRDDILLKPSAPNKEEWEILKLHPSIGAEILSPIPSLAYIIPAIAGHHERIDGNGYPAGLKGDRIHLMARMIAVADTYDALTSDRPYRKGFSHEKAITIIEEVKGSQLCPDCVQSFLNFVEKKMKT